MGRNGEAQLTQANPDRSHPAKTVARGDEVLGSEPGGIVAPELVSKREAGVAHPPGPGAHWRASSVPRLASPAPLASGGVAVHFAVDRGQVTFFAIVEYSAAFGVTQISEATRNDGRATRPPAQGRCLQDAWSFGKTRPLRA